MNLKLRFALLFNFFVAFILLCSCIIIYILYKNYREDDFKQRLITEANTLFSEYNLVSSSDSLPINIINQLHSNNLANQQLTILNDYYKVVYNYPTKIIPSYLNDSSLYKHIKEETIYNFKFGDRETVGLFFKENNTYIVASAVDIGGLKKLKGLKYILILVFCGALIISIITAFFFVRQAFKPLVKLSNQMADTTAQNLTKKVDEGKGNDEINLIARNFNAMLKRLNNAFEGQKTFVQNASHELRTPLATMLSQTEAALNRNLDVAGYKKVLASLKEDQTDLIELTNSLLLISQYEKITFLSTWPIMRVDELLYETIAGCKRMFAGIDVDLNFRELPENEAGLMAFCSDSLLKSAFRNLIKNAYNYSDNKKVSIVIAIEKPFIIITFTNTGNQLSQSEIDKIKMPFFRGKNASTKKGYGLGLSIVTRIIELHKGTLNYDAVDDNRNMFTIILPIA